MPKHGSNPSSSLLPPRPFRPRRTPRRAKQRTETNNLATHYDPNRFFRSRSRQFNRRVDSKSGAFADSEPQQDQREQKRSETDRCHYSKQRRRPCKVVP